MTPIKNSHSILVVDDDAAGRAMLSISLRQAGFTVKTVCAGAEALAELERARYGWLVTDARMQPMNGFDLTVRAKQIQPGLRVIMVSALYTESDARKYPIDKFFPKPLPIEDLVGWVSAGTR